jgi:hypothetical protein
MNDIIARIDALLANTPPAEIKEFEVTRCLRDAKAEIVAARRHECRWGNDPSGPHFSDEYLESLERALAFEDKAFRDGVIDLNLLYPNAGGRFYSPATQPPPPAPPAPCSRTPETRRTIRGDE